jgi:hypothetical protein
MISLSVIIPVFNRVQLLAYPLRSLRAAAAAAPGLDWEIIVVDDGSSEDVPAAIAPFSDLPLRVQHQPNRGLLAARLAGLALAQHEAVLFLDGDDLVQPGKFATQLPALRDHDVTYGDTGRIDLPLADEPIGELRPDAPVGTCSDPADFYLRIQPAPHNPIFRRSYLAGAIANAVSPPSRTYDPIAETWYYYQLSVRPARIANVPGLWTVIGEHRGERISGSWERQGYAALHLMGEFMRACPVTPATESARRRVGLCAFATWRAFPHSFHGFPADELLAVWRAAPHSPLSALGGRNFQRLARLLGPVLAGRCLKRLQRPAYARIRTLNHAQLSALVHG